MIRSRPHKPAPNVLRQAASVGVKAALGWIGYSTFFISHQMPLPPALAGTRREFSGAAGRMSYYTAGSGAPLLLIHSINAAASAYEVRPLFDQYQAQRRVYAVDLPGFGFSDRSPRDYTSRFYTDAILAMVEEIRRDTGAMQVDALALSLSSEFLARAAVEQATHFNSVALVSPTGFGKTEQLYGPLGSTRGTPLVRDLYEFPLWSQAFFDLLSTRPSLTYFLKKTFGSYETIDQGLLAYDYLTAHQPNAQHAPYAFISGLLFSADIDRIYEALDVPVWMCYGTKIEFSDFSDTHNVQNKSNWTLQAFPTGGLPHFEQRVPFIAAYDAFLERIDS